VLVAPNSFKGTLTATRAAAAIAEGLEAVGRSVDRAPVADGGDGTLEVLLGKLGGTTETVAVHDPLGRPRRAELGLSTDGNAAIVEVAQASGLELLGPHERDGESADSTGAGELIAAAIESCARTVLIGAGGIASTDAGAGALAVLPPHPGVELLVLCDVRTPFEQAAERFGPQKGADAQAVRRLQRRLAAYADELPRDPRGVPMTGAAGGLAGGLWAAAGARLVPGASYVLDALDIDRRLRASHAVVVGEGRLDRTTLEGKAPGELAVRARQTGVPAHAIVGENALDRFDARILDLQEIIEARTLAGLRAAGKRLAASL
jgi:glycerate kinase